MHKAFSMALASLFAVSCLLADDLKAEPKRNNPYPVQASKPKVILAYAKQTPHVAANCFPGRLQSILAHIALRTGRRPLVTSGHRHAGRRGSLHRKCWAADIRVPGVSVSRIIAAAKNAPGIGGIGTYCNGIVHVDIGPRRHWHYC